MRVPLLLAPAIVAVLLAAVLGAAPPVAGATTTPATPAPKVTERFAAHLPARPGDRVRYVRPGVVHVQRVTDAPLRINLLLVDLSSPRVEAAVAVHAGWLAGRDRTSNLARQGGAVAAVNGDLFSADEGVPQGLTMIDGRVLTAPKFRATFAWGREAGPFIGYFTDQWTWRAEVRAGPGERAAVTLLNTRCPAEQICLYNEFARVVPAREGDVKVVLAPDGLVRRVVREVRLRVQPGERVLQGTGAGAYWLAGHARPGAWLAVVVAADPPLERFEHAISGGPLILRDGEFVQDCLCTLRDCRQTSNPQTPRLCEDFSTEWKLKHYLDVRMPRTAVAFDRDGKTLILAVVDGYQPGYSRGITQGDLADLLREFGAHTAMELDGGGSSTMVVEQKVVNSPPDETGERYVANALLIRWRE